MQSPAKVRMIWNPIIFSLLDDGNPNCVGVELLPILVSEDDVPSETELGSQSRSGMESKVEGGDIEVTFE